MDREPGAGVLQYVGFAESCRLIASHRHRRLFGQITASLLFPLSLLFLAALQIWCVAGHWLLFILSEVIVLCFFNFFSRLSTSAFIYTVASIFTAKDDDLSFREVLNAATRVSDRLESTYVCAYCTLVLYASASVFVISLSLSIPAVVAVGFSVFFLLLLACLAGFVWIGAICYVGSVVAVLEENSKVIETMRKARRLVSGKAGLLTCTIFFLLALSFFAIYFAYVM